LNDATNRSRQISLKRYLQTLPQINHEAYPKKDPEMPDCIICLVSFTSKDLLVVFSCDEKHYFHRDCGIEWLQVKTECPLCRFDFGNEIQDFINNQSGADMRSDGARDLNAWEDSTYGQNGRGHDNESLRTDQEQNNANELVRKLTV